MSPHNPYASRPRTIQELANRAEQGIQWSDRYGLKIWLKSALSLVRTAEQLEQERDVEGAFVLIARAATVILEKLPTHPDFAKSLSPVEKANLRHNGEQYLNSLSRLKLLLLKRFDYWHKQHPEWSIEGEKELLKAGDVKAGHGPVGTSAAAASSTTSLGSAGPIDRPSSSSSITTPVPRREKNTVHWETSEPRYSRDRSRSDVTTVVPPTPSTTGPSTEMAKLEDDFRRMRTFTDSYRGHDSSGWQGGPTYQNANPISYAPISYPTLTTGHRHAEPYIPTYPQHYDDGRSSYQATPPPLPRPPQLHARLHGEPSFPPIPTGVGNYYRTQSRDVSSTPVPKPRASKPRSGLRRLLIPASILSTFLDIARPQTSRKIETCALLLGTSRERGSLDHEELVVEVLLVPKQKGGSDTCQMEEEEMVVEVQLERGLIALGWIHTHPTQSCFMSSMDLHTHSAYQQTLPEAVAIVCAPTSDPSYGIFRLTEPTGLSTIIKCKRSALFHEHPDVKGGIYTDADGGHVKLTSGGGVEVIDLRRR